ncbi:alpha/beta fold hydrolase [Candidatus Gottesmanbacteria bacterium]|nr:alpha/beta fold hydrolase [Candidatus Gottesmanbacteria bacterium]
MSEELRVSIKNKRGLQLAGVLHIPRGKGKCPAIINLHGFTGYKEEENSVELAKALAARGFVVIRFDASGDNESEGTLANDYRITNYLSDIDAVYKFLYKHPRVNNKRIGIWGHSMGAMLAIIWGSKHAELKAICSVSPPIQMGTTDWLGQFLDSWKKTGWFTKVSTSGHGASKVPWAFMVDAKRYNTLTYVKNVRSPLMIVLGLAEDTVPPEHTRKIFREAHEPKVLLEVEGMSHDYKKVPEHLRYVNSKILPFFEKYLS